MSKVTVEVNTSGPWFDGRATAEINRFIEELKDQVASEGRSMIQTRLPEVIKRYTGRYARSITIASLDKDRVIEGSNIIYGAWLEGIGSRNYPVTRFKGYHTFKQTAKVLSGQVTVIADRLWTEKYEEKVN